MFCKKVSPVDTHLLGSGYCILANKKDNSKVCDPAHNASWGEGKGYYFQPYTVEEKYLLIRTFL